MPHAVKKDDFRTRYRERLAREFATPDLSNFGPTVTSNYIEFKRELLPPQFTMYEKLCNISEKILKISPGKKTRRTS